MIPDIELQIFSDFVCPWCYFNIPDIQRLQDKYTVRVVWKSFALGPETPLEGLTLEQYFEGQIVDTISVKANLARAAANAGVPFTPPDKLFNTARAHRLAKWATAQGGGPAFRAALFEAYFVQGRNIADPEVLAALLAACGLDAAAGLEVMDSEHYAAMVDDDLATAREWDIDVAPTFLAGEHGLAGAQSLEKLARLVTAAGGRLRS